MAYDRSNVFARILRGEIPAYTVLEDEHTLAFMDVMPQADGHALVIPKAEAESSRPATTTRNTTTVAMARVDRVSRNVISRPLSARRPTISSGKRRTKALWGFSGHGPGGGAAARAFLRPAGEQAHHPPW
jgi:hypothetical protein